ncbi:hypothetical protein DSCO28_05850 [Desulfosarcina ovata subsp. sediminis]|uniref:DUF6794 domain-containing protein n=1 Tax=Desulfosarcina ovata subsp. sediminis TaxID=885957 RepID=A0A5K7ZK43_9BACT|nr:putative molybdenum carrier protein [Desulfosarcina ovata]BBO80019.1 hypothetical protein DSCO28_05850 [Desulfosarcina ovata subsp. sediminis]
MIEKIIADGQPGAGAAALDIAIKVGLAHGGWCLESDAIDARFALTPLVDGTAALILEKAVGAADGSLYFTTGLKNTIAEEAIRKAAHRLGKPHFVVALPHGHISAFTASREIAEWVVEQRIKTLHVDGDGRSADFCAKVGGILEAAFFLAMMGTGISSPLASMIENERIPMPIVPPRTLDAALDHLERTLSLKDKTTIANMVASELVSLHFTLGDYINRHFGLHSGDSELLTDCQRRSGRWTLAPEDAVAVIVRFLWERFRENYRIRIIK